MVSAVENTDIKQKDADRAVVVAVSSHAVFEPGDDGDDDVYGTGVAFPLLQAMQRVNQCLLEEDPAESLLFDVVLITTDSRQQNSRIISSTRHYGLEISRFCFSDEEDFVESLRENKVQLFLSTDRNETWSAAQRGVLCAVLDRQETPSEQLRVMFSGDAVVRPDTDTTPATRQAAQTFCARLGVMRGRFGLADSPLSLVLVTCHGGRDGCGAALRTLRSRGVSVDEAYCLGGAPRTPILALLQPHFLLTDGISSPED